MNKVFFYRANIVDYVRLVLLVGAFVAHNHPYVFFVLYALSQLMDMLDGYMARKYDECSSFGAVLDMVLDRASDSMIFVLLGMLYPAYNALFAFLALLDLCSHWTHMFASVLGHHHHKECTNPLLRLYYRKAVLALLCAGNEGCWLSLYLLHWAPHMFSGAATLARILLCVCAPLAAFKQVISLVQWFDACDHLGLIDLQQREARTQEAASASSTSSNDNNNSSSSSSSSSTLKQRRSGTSA